MEVFREHCRPHFNERCATQPASVSSCKSVIRHAHAVALVYEHHAKTIYQYLCHSQWRSALAWVHTQTTGENVHTSRSTWQRLSRADVTLLLREILFLITGHASACATVFRMTVAGFEAAVTNMHCLALTGKSDGGSASWTSTTSRPCWRRRAWMTRPTATAAC